MQPCSRGDGKTKIYDYYFERSEICIDLTAMHNHQFIHKIISRLFAELSTNLVVLVVSLYLVYCRSSDFCGVPKIAPTFCSAA